MWYSPRSEKRSIDFSFLCRREETDIFDGVIDQHDHCARGAESTLSPRKSLPSKTSLSPLDELPAPTSTPFFASVIPSVGGRIEAPVETVVKLSRGSSRPCQSRIHARFTLERPVAKLAVCFFAELLWHPFWYVLGLGLCVYLTTQG